MFIYHFLFFIFCSDPEKAMLLLLPGNPNCDDITFHLQAKLIEAYCWEHHIHVIKINDTSALCKHVQRSKRAQGGKSVKHVKATDFSCVLVEVRVKFINKL